MATKFSYKILRLLAHFTCLLSLAAGELVGRSLRKKSHLILSITLLPTASRLDADIFRALF